MNRFSRLRRAGFAFVILAAGLHYLGGMMPRWFPAAYGGAWGPLGAPDSRTVPASLRRLPVVFVDGADEGRRSGCGDLDPRRVQIITLPGGHHFNGDYDAIARHILDSLPGPRGGDPVRYAASNRFARLTQAHSFQ